MKIMTYNVHVWYDDNGQFKLQEMIDLCNEVKPDVLCLQEITKGGLNEFVKQTGFERVVKYHGCAILSNLDIEQVPLEHRNYYPRFVSVRVPVSENQHFYVTCLHLDYKVETSRIKELEQIKKHLGTLDPNAAQVWAGDFNALCFDDYSEDELKEITSVRKKNRWEMPRNDVTSTMTGKYGFQCSWSLAGKPAPFSTCRFDTHIDYIYTNSEFRKIFKVKSVIHHASKASDHAPVIAEFEPVSDLQEKE
eukprot:TRINITY_DN16303_c0_g1_i2.p1 TRINITY_DN16303_c0_g1~~TRINITY_DN16303_c0_g1_i2.p1  ORF type:complete len:272 (-),score=48.52 TRINITY_DN16303_c0_g1_i2:47-793(-)